MLPTLPTERGLRGEVGVRGVMLYPQLQCSADLHAARSTAKNVKIKKKVTLFVIFFVSKCKVTQKSPNFAYNTGNF